MSLIGAEHVVGICRIINDGDVIFANLNRLASLGISKFIISDMQSSDNTRAEIERFAKRQAVKVFIIDDPDREVLGSKMFTGLAAFAATALGSTWILPFDADDFLWIAPSASINLNELDVDFILLPWLQLHPASLDNTSIEALLGGDRLASVVRPNASPGKIMVRWRDDMVIERGQHWAHSKSGRVLIGVRGEDIGATMVHIPIRSSERFIGKVTTGARAEKVATGLTHVTHHSALGQTLEREGRPFLESLIDAMWRRDKKSFLDLCHSRKLDPKQYGYLSDLALLESIEFLPPADRGKWLGVDTAQRILAFRRKDRDTKHRVDVTTRLRVALLRMRGYSRAS
jgi:hypothetical protein